MKGSGRAGVPQPVTRRVGLILKRVSSHGSELMSIQWKEEAESSQASSVVRKNFLKLALTAMATRSEEGTGCDIAKVLRPIFKMARTVMSKLMRTFSTLA